MEALGLPTVCVVSDQFEGLALAVRNGMKAHGATSSRPTFVVLPYPISGLDSDVVVQKAIAAGPEVARALAHRLTSADSEAEEPR